MRRFIITGHTARTDDQFIVEDLPGSGGRMDIMIRCINASLMLSHGIRTDTEVYLVLTGQPDPPKCIRVHGASLRNLNPDEHSTAHLLKKALGLPLFIKERESSPGIFVSHRDLSRVLEDISKGAGDKQPRVVYCIESGQEAESAIRAEGENDLVFILGDNQDLTDEEEAILKTYDPVRINLGPESIHSNHCIVVIQNVLDRLQVA